VSTFSGKDQVEIKYFNTKDENHIETFLPA